MSDRIGRYVVADIVDTGHQKNLRRATAQHGLQSRSYAGSYVAAYATVFNPRVAEQLVPLAAVGKRIAEKDNIGGIDGQNPESITFAIMD